MITTIATGSKSRGAGKLALAHAQAGKASDNTIKHMTRIFKMLGDASRLKILIALAQQGEMHVTALCDILSNGTQKASQPAVSHHLSLMRAYGLVSYRRDGKNNYYRIDSAMLGSMFEQFFSDTGNNNKQLHFEEFSLSYKRK